MARDFVFRPAAGEDGELRFGVSEIEEFARCDILARSSATNPEVHARNVVAALRATARGGTITLAEYDRAVEHVKQRHRARSLGFSGLKPLHAQDGRYTQTVVFSVPYHARYGLFHVGRARKFAPPGLDAALLEPLLPACYELRGHGPAAGIQALVEHLDRLAALLGHSCQDQIDAGCDDPPGDFTYRRWYFLAPNESSQLFPVDRETGQVHGPEGRFPLHEFLKTHMHHSPLDAFVEHSERSFLDPGACAGGAPSCTGSVSDEEDSDDELRFRFTNRRTESWLADASGRRRQRAPASGDAPAP